MQIDPIKLKAQSKLMKDYRNNHEDIMSFFDYLPYNNFEKRLQDLQDRSFEREQLTEVLHTINKSWDAPSSTFESIAKLKQDDSVVVIGGQQAGLLTGPMYTINKVISIIQHARTQQEILGIPVIPVFWIAGEDHDFDEVNHIYLPESSRMKKCKLKHHMVEKKSLSDIRIDKVALSNWIEQLFSQMEETMHSKKLYETIQDVLDCSDTYVDFFARIIFQLFRDEGIVLIDSGHELVRKLEAVHFQKMIKAQPQISEGVYTALTKLNEKEYSVSLEVEPTDGHLFYHQNKERVLLTRDASGEWRGKKNEIVLTTDDLMATARNNPEQLSNNVVTRPLMQELLFPTLSFIGGPGEVGYWAGLKPAFRALDLKMPPVVPRLSFTFVDRNVGKALDQFDMNIINVIQEGAVHSKENWFKSKSEPEIEQLVSDIKSTIESVHRPLRELAIDIRADLGELGEKNLLYLYRDIDFLKDRIVKAQEERYKKELCRFDLIDLMLHPNGGLQERVWSPVYWINKYGTEFITELTSESCSFEKDHYLVYL